MVKEKWIGKEDTLIKGPQSSGEMPDLGGFCSGPLCALSLTFASFSLVYKLQEILTLSPSLLSFLPSPLPSSKRTRDHTRPPPFQVLLPLFA